MGGRTQINISLLMDHFGLGEGVPKFLSLPEGITLCCSWCGALCTPGG